MVIWLLAGVAAAIALAYRQAAATLWLGVGLVWLAVGYLFNVVEGFGATVAALLVLAPALLMTIKPLRRSLLTSKDRKSTRLNSSHGEQSRMPSSA